MIVQMVRVLVVLVLAGASVNAQSLLETFGSGANQFSIDFVTIGNDCFIAMGASVLKDIPDSTSVMPYQSPIIEGEKSARIMKKATGGENRE